MSIQNLFLGAHVSAAGGVRHTIPRGVEIGCTAIQVFVKNASRWTARSIPNEEADAFRTARETSSIGPVVAHASYLINLAATDAEKLEKSRLALADELDRCDQLGLDGLVVHPGAHLGEGEDAGITAIAASLDVVLLARTQGTTRLLLENTAGQGTVLGYRLEQLATMIGRAESGSEVGVCLDSCHAFAAGYAIHEPEGYAEFWEEVEQVLGLDRVGCIHLNDSLREFGSRRDRHANIGQGEIGPGFFERLLTDPRSRTRPLILETPLGDDERGHEKDLVLLRSWLPLT